MFDIFESGDLFNHCWSIFFFCLSFIYWFSHSFKDLFQASVRYYYSFYIRNTCKVWRCNHSISYCKKSNTSIVYVTSCLNYMCWYTLQIVNKTNENCDNSSGTKTHTWTYTGHSYTMWYVLFICLTLYSNRSKLRLIDRTLE